MVTLVPPVQILVVDNEPIIAKAMESRLKRAGYRVPAIAESGEEAVMLADSLNPDLVLMDIGLGNGIDGVEAAHQIRESLDIPIIFVTGYDEESVLARAKAAGPFGFLVKPVENKDLHSAIEIALYKHAAEKKLKTQVERLTMIRGIDEAILANHSLAVTMSSVLNQITTHLPADAADVMLINPVTQNLEYHAGTGFTCPADQPRILPMGMPFAGLIAQLREPLATHNFLNGSRMARPGWMASEGFQAYFGYPIISKNQVKGVFELYYRHPVDPSDDWLEFLDALVRQITIAVDNALMFEELQGAHNELVNAYNATIEGWSLALELRDFETQGHCQRVTDLTLKMARAMGIEENQLAHIRRGALLHDIGKMAVPDSILLKKGPLSSQEWALMKMHPQHAYDLLRNIPFLQPALDIPYCHHEKWDGTGYPRGLKGEQIPLGARIFTIADVWDALHTDRPYRKAWTEPKAVEYLQQQAGRHFDPQLIDMFLPWFIKA